MCLPGNEYYGYPTQYQNMVIKFISLQFISLSETGSFDRISYRIKHHLYPEDAAMSIIPFKTFLVTTASILLRIKWWRQQMEQIAPQPQREAGPITFPVCISVSSVISWMLLNVPFRK